MMSNEQLLTQLWAASGLAIDEQWLRIFKLMTATQQREILEQIEREAMNQTNKTPGLSQGHRRLVLADCGTGT